MQMGWITKNVMEKGILTILISVISLGFLLVLRGGMPILLAGCLGVTICCCYTLGPKPLAYVGFAEILIFFIFGSGELLGAYYIQSFTWCNEALVMGISPGLLACALSLTNNLRDVDRDRLHKKRTIAVRLGSRFARFSILALVMSSVVGPLLMVFVYGYSWWIMVSCLALVKPMIHFPMILMAPISRQFNLMLKSLGQALYLFGIAASIGIIYGAP